MMHKKSRNIRSKISILLVLVMLVTILAPATAVFAEPDILYVPAGQCTATASSVHIYGSTNTPDKAVDDNIYTLWQSDSAAHQLPQWIKINLGGVYPVSQLESCLIYFEGVPVDHEIWVSEDDVDYTLAFSGTWNDYAQAQWSWMTDSFSPIPAQYVKLVVNTAKNRDGSDSPHTSIGEIKIGYVDEGTVISQPTGIEIISPPAKTQYNVGELFASQGMVVKADYDDGTSRNLAAGEYQLSGFDSSTAGTKTVTVTFAGFTASFEVTVEDLAQGEIEYVPSGECTAFASSETGGGWNEGPANAIDGSTGTKWCSTTTEVLPQWIAVDLGDVYDTVTQLKYFLAGNEWTARIMGYEVWVSEDNDTYTQVSTGQWANVPGVWYEANFDPVRARYVKLVATSAGQNVSDTSTRASVSELQIGYQGYGEDYPSFTADPTQIEVTAGQTATVHINRNTAAQALSGTYTFDVPDGWTVLSGSAFAAGSAVDEIVFNVPAEYAHYTDTVKITPTVGEASYRRVTVNVKNAGFSLIEGRTTVITPEYRSDISGDTQIEFVCLGGTTASVYVQKQPNDLNNVDTNGTREAIGGIITLDNGRGVVTFPADEYPKGPTTLRIKVWKNGADLDDSYLQLYNLNGVEWKTGLENAPVNPVTESMNVTFSDDFKAMPSISFSGEGTTYASVKPDERQGGQFGFAAFEDYDGPYNPFSIDGNEFLNITTTYRGDDYTSPNARWRQKATTGLISSMAMDGSGFHTQGGADQYFEARIFCPPTPGMWPAFWTLTANNYADSPSGYGGEPTDELDILEGYMKWPEKYSIAWHPWDGSIAQNPTDNGGGTWPVLDADPFSYINLAMGFHIFGVHITQNTTNYYCDNVLVASHPTMELSYELGNYFLINGSISDHIITNINYETGTYDYNDEPFGFFRYGNENNMYVDWVRVYEENPNEPHFSAAAATVDAEPGDEISLQINRNEAAKALTGTYEITFPGTGWETVSGTSFATGSETDTIVVKVPSGYTSETGVITVTPVVGENRLTAVRVTAKAVTNSQTIVIDGSTYPYGGGPWANYTGWKDTDTFSFDFSGGNWWSDSWGWMYAGNGANLNLSFEGTSVSASAYKGTYSGDTKVFIDGTYIKTISAYDPVDKSTPEKIFEETGLPSGEHTLRLEFVGGAGKYLRFTGFAYTHIPTTIKNIAVNGSTHPYGGGPWSNYTGWKDSDTFSFDFSGGNWWSDSWGWMYAGNNASLNFTFQGTTVSAQAYKGQYTGNTKVYIDGEQVDTVDLYDSVNKDAPETIFEETGLPAGEHTLRLEFVGGAGKYLRLTGFAYTYDSSIAVPRFTVDASELNVTPGAQTSIIINRNEAAQELSGTYQVTFPGEGWSVVSGAAFTEGSAEDTLVIAVPASYSAQDGVITVIPRAGGYNYGRIEITAVAPVLPPTNIVTLISPAYRANLEGETVLNFSILGGYSKAEAFSLVTSAGEVVSLGSPVTLDANGSGSVTFDADILPHGPVTVRIIAEKPDGTKSRDNYFQFYNNGGATTGNAGLDNAPLPSQLGGMDMEVVFADDYEAMPSISQNGVDANGNPTTYIAHKPDYGDYGLAQFADYEGPNNPFSQIEDYLKITTAYDEDLVDGYNRDYYTGFLSSVNRVGEGFHTDGFVNQYFEARFFTGANPGLWPAFWTLSANNYSGAEGPCDELDIIEGYMAWPDSYSIAMHPWGEGHPNQDLSGGLKVTTEAMYGQKGNIAMGFHTYGMLITEDITYFYFDNNLVYQEPTLWYSWSEGNYFMINSAMSDHRFPQGYDFRRYGDESHMYIDWVRVYQQADPDNIHFSSIPKTYEVHPGDTLDVKIDRTEGAQALSGHYNVELPDGWSLVSGDAFAAGSASDTLTFQIDENSVSYNNVLKIVPVANGVSYSEITVKARTITPFDVEVYPVLNSAGNGWDVAVKLINGFETAAVSSGYVQVVSPAFAAGQYPFDSIAAGDSVMIKVPGTLLKLNELTNYNLKIVRDDGYERTLDRSLSTLTVVKSAAPITVDGVINEDEWDGAMDINMGADAATNYGASRPWGGENDLSAVGRVKWDDEYLYISAVVKDDVHFMESNVPSSWSADSLQFSMDQGRAAGYSDDQHSRFIAALNSADGSYGLAVEYKGLLESNPSTDKCVIKRDETAKTTTYELALKWSEILFDEQYPPQPGSLDIGFSLLINDNDGDANGRVGWLRYMDGIGYGKHGYQFGDMILTNMPSLTEQVVNKQALTAAITAEVGEDHDNPSYVLTEADYTEGSWSVYTDAIEAAIEVEGDTAATQAEVDAAAAAIGTAKAALEFASEEEPSYTLAVGNESIGGAGRIRIITIGGSESVNLEGKYLVVQITEGTGEEAKVSVVMISPQNQAVLVSYRVARTKVEVWITSGMPDLVGEDMDVEIYAHAVNNQ